MHKSSRQLAVFLFFLAIILINPVWSFAKGTVSIKELQKVIQEGKSAFTLEEAQEALVEVRPLVEKFTGRKFDGSIEVKLVDRVEMTTVLQKELSIHNQNLYPGLTEDQVKEISRRQAAQVSIILIGKYGLIDQNLYLMPKNLYPLMKLARVDSKYSKSILKLVVAHELVHAIQDQETDLKRTWDITNLDEITAFSATIEGHAVLVQEQLGQELNLEQPVIEMSRLLSAGAVTFEDPALEMLNKIIATQYEQIYLGGKKFMEYHYKLGGNERLWEIIEKPPFKTQMIAKPETYSPEKQLSPDYASLFENLQSELPGEWQIQNTEVGHIALRSVYAKLDEPSREEVIGRIEHVQAFVAAKENQVFSIAAILIKDPLFAERYLAILEEMAQKNLKEIESSKLVGVEDFTIDDCSLIQGDICRKISFNLIQKKSGLRINQEFIRVFRGKMMLEIYLSNLKLEDSVINNLAEKIFLRYRQLSGK